MVRKNAAGARVLAVSKVHVGFVRHGVLVVVGLAWELARAV